MLFGRQAFIPVQNRFLPFSISSIDWENYRSTNILRNLESGRSNLGMLLARQHLFISLASAKTVSGWSNLGMLSARQH